MIVTGWDTILKRAHIGDRRPGHGGTCASPTTGATNPNSNFASIAAAKNAAAFLASTEMDIFIGRKIQNVVGGATALYVARDRPTLAVMNIGDVGTLGPTEAACAIQHLLTGIRTVMPSHIYEQGTDGGAVRPGSRLENFIGQVSGFADVVVPLSKVTRTFDGSGRARRRPRTGRVPHLEIRQ